MESSRDLQPAFAVIRQYDPATYARMRASDWQVTTNPDDVPAWVAQGCDESFGVTETLGRHPLTLINPDNVAEWSDERCQDARWFMADVLVHEFVHTTQTGLNSPAQEIPAFRAGAAFARKLPPEYGREIVQESDADMVEETEKVRRRREAAGLNPEG
jgi:hypothetical protein